MQAGLKQQGHGSSPNSIQRVSPRVKTAETCDHNHPHHSPSGLHHPAGAARLDQGYSPSSAHLLTEAVRLELGYKGVPDHEPVSLERGHRDGSDQGVGLGSAMGYSGDVTGAVAILLTKSGGFLADKVAGAGAMGLPAGEEVLNIVDGKACLNPSKLSSAWGSEAGVPLP